MRVTFTDTNHTVTKIIGRADSPVELQNPEMNVLAALAGNVQLGGRAPLKAKNKNEITPDF